MNTNYTEIITDMNIELFEKHGDHACLLDYSTDGFYHAIQFGGLRIWDSENDNREWIESENDYEPLEPFLKKELNRLMDELGTFKF